MSPSEAQLSAVVAGFWAAFATQAPGTPLVSAACPEGGCEWPPTSVAAPPAPAPPPAPGAGVDQGRSRMRLDVGVPQVEAFSNANCDFWAQYFGVN
jgi:hypothetical protein